MFVLSRKSLKILNSRSLSHYKFVVAGGGAGGCAAASFLTKHGPTAIIDPAESHYYQPMWTLVGAGIKTMAQTRKPQSSCVPKKAVWIKKYVESFEPDNNMVVLGGGEKVTYDYLVVALGLDIRFDLVPGLMERLGSGGVCSNYGPDNANYTWQTLSTVKDGKVLFTYPNAPIKCAGAPQKIMYLAHTHLTQRGVRGRCDLQYHTALPSIFGVPKYAAALSQLAKEKNCTVAVKSNLVEVRDKEAVFEDLDTGTLTTLEFSMLHVGPPCAPSPVYAKSPLADSGGWVDTNKHTLQHNKFPNVFAIGDCNSCPTGKTAAKAAAESGILQQNMKALLAGRELSGSYNGYTSCPLTVGDKKLVLAEFGYDGAILETFPWNQAKPSWFTYFLKKDVMPALYWYGVLNGLWTGPGIWRKIFHLGRD